MQKASWQKEIIRLKKKLQTHFMRMKTKTQMFLFFQTDVIQLMKSWVSHFVNFCAWMRHSRFSIIIYGLVIRVFNGIRDYNGIKQKKLKITRRNAFVFISMVWCICYLCLVPITNHKSATGIESSVFGLKQIVYLWVIIIPVHYIS